MKILTAVLAALLVAGCATVTPLTDEGAQVRKIGANSTDDCRFLGVVHESEGATATQQQDFDSAMNKVRNSVAELGGNAFVQVAAGQSPMSADIQADAYEC